MGNEIRHFGGEPFLVFGGFLECSIVAAGPVGGTGVAAVEQQVVVGERPGVPKKFRDDDPVNDVAELGGDLRHGTSKHVPDRAAGEGRR